MPSKEYRARISVKLSDDILPTPMLSRTELEALLVEALHVGDEGSPVEAVSVSDPSNDRGRRRY